MAGLTKKTKPLSVSTGSGFACISMFSDCSVHLLQHKSAAGRYVELQPLLARGWRLNIAHGVVENPLIDEAEAAILGIVGVEHHLVGARLGEDAIVGVRLVGVEEYST